MSGRFADTTLADFAARLADKVPSPGGGAVAAVTLAHGAALGAMVLRYTVGRANFAAHEAQNTAALAELDAMRAEALRLADRDAAAYARLAALWKLPEGDATRARDFQPAVREAHIVCCATTSTEPLVQGAWLRPGTHLDLVGGFRPDMREVDDETVARAHVVVDTLEAALSEAGDLVQPLARGVIGAGHVAADLGMLVRGRVVGRPDAAALTVFKSVGTALADLAAAELVIHGRRGGG